jgi:membrane associated rhomboid family serine protease
MTTLLGSLDGLFGDPDERGSQVEDGVVISAEAAQAAHRDALQLARQRMRTALWWLVPAAAVLVAALTVPYGLFLLPWAVAPMAWVTYAGYGWWRLSRIDPLVQWQRDYREEIEEKATIRAIVARMLAVRGHATNFLLVLVIAVTAVQFFGPGIANSVELAALVKSATRDGEWWRMLSAAFLHGSILHIYGNALGLFVLGRMVEGYSRPSRVALAFLVGAMGGHAASMIFLPVGSSLGASGGVLGLAGYLLGITTGGSALELSWLRTRLWFMLAQIAFWGAVYYFVVDNAGHAGGCVAGFLLGLTTTWFDKRGVDGRSRGVEAVAYASSIVLVLGAAFTVGRLLQVW